MARFTVDASRLNFNVERRGKEYNQRVLQRAQAVFSTLLLLLPAPGIFLCMPLVTFYTTEQSCGSSADSRSLASITSDSATYSSQSGPAGGILVSPHFGHVLTVTASAL